MPSDGTVGIDGMEGRPPSEGIDALGRVMFGSPISTPGKGVGAESELNVGAASVGAVIVGPLGVFRLAAAAPMPASAAESWPP